jgi:nicotinate-nucleotide pyrophosphorylase (carboxylating)
MKPSIVDPIDAALGEDIGDGDLTTDFFVSKNQQAMARIVAHEHAIVAGTDTAAEVFRRVDAATEITVLRKDGGEVNPDETVIELRGPARSILKAERVA